MSSMGSIEKRKGGLKEFAKSAKSKVHFTGEKNDDDDRPSFGNIGPRIRSNILDVKQSRQTVEDAEPGVVSDNENFTYDALSHKSPESSPNQPASQNNNAKIKDESREEGSIPRHKVATIPVKPPRKNIRTQGELDLKLCENKPKTLLKSKGIGRRNKRLWDSPMLSLRIQEEDETDLKRTESEELVASPQKERKSRFLIPNSFINEKSELDLLRKDKFSIERSVIDGENQSVPIQTSVTNSCRISNELIQKFEGKSTEDLILMACELQSDLDHYKKKMKDVEDLSRKVLETTSELFQNPYIQSKLTQNLI